MRVSGVTREGFGNRCEFRARFGQNQRVRCEMMLETLIYFRIWAVTVRFARFGCSKLATISRIQQTQKTDAYKKAGGTPIQFHRLVPTGLAGCSSSRARRLFQGQRQKRSEAARRGASPPRGGGERHRVPHSAFKGIEAERWKQGNFQIAETNYRSRLVLVTIMCFIFHEERHHFGGE